MTDETVRVGKDAEGQVLYMLFGENVMTGTPSNGSVEIKRNGVVAQREIYQGGMLVRTQKL